MIQNHTFVLTSDDPEEVKQLAANTLDIPLSKINDLINQALSELRGKNIKLTNIGLVIRCDEKTWKYFLEKVSAIREENKKTKMSNSIRTNFNGEMDLCE